MGNNDHETIPLVMPWHVTFLKLDAPQTIILKLDAPQTIILKLDAPQTIILILHSA